MPSTAYSTEEAQNILFCCVLEELLGNLRDSENTDFDVGLKGKSGLSVSNKSLRQRSKTDSVLYYSETVHSSKDKTLKYTAERKG